MHDEYRIIVAEDNPLLASVLTRLILRHRPNALVQAFGNGRDALAGYDQTGADLVFCNHALPFLDGPTLIRILRTRRDAVPIIGMSGDPFLHNEYMAAGASAFLPDVELMMQLPALLRRFLPPTPRSASLDAARCLN